MALNMAVVVSVVHSEQSQLPGSFQLTFMVPQKKPAESSNLLFFFYL